ncbi:MAG: hypothetical protein JO272_18500 [Pseudonocardiales bacterium]|nr:hypothetical protein [Pseudonocardiales bacterium]
MSKHEDKDKAEEEKKIYSNGYFPGRDVAPKDPGGKHSKEDDEDEEDKGSK